MKKLSKLLLVFALLFTIMPTTVHAGDAGSLGSLTWEYSNGTLTLEGTSSASEIPYYENAINYPWNVYRNEITTLNLINVSSVGESAFKGYEDLKTVTINEGLTLIDQNAFENCKNLSSLTMPTTVTWIASEAFLNCEKLTKVTIPSNVNNLGNSVFEGCTGLTEVNIEAKLTEIVDGLFQNCKNLKSVNIPETVKTIGGDAFNGCSSLTSVSIPDSVVTIYDAAFDNCPNLKKVYIPKGVKTIDNGPFAGCYDKVKEKYYYVEGFTVYGVAGTKAEKYAKTCGFKFVNHTSHKWNSGKTLKAATCTTKGSKLYTCTTCNHTKIETIATHSFNIYDKCTKCGTMASYIDASVPKMTVKSISKGKNYITVKWKKNTKVKGYEIRYSTKSSMSGAKTVKITKYKTTSKKIKSLKRKTTYYVQIRAYKTISGKTKYSPWSAVKSSKTK